MAESIFYRRCNTNKSSNMSAAVSPDIKTKVVESELRMEIANYNKELFGYEVKLISETKESSTYSLLGADGDIKLRIFPVFPGISIVFEDVHAQNCTFKRTVSDNVFEIQHCREGRLELSSQSDYYYIGPGDLSIAKTHNGENQMYFPLHHFHGLSVIIDVDKTPRCLSCILKDVDVMPATLMEKFCSHDETFVARSMTSIEHVFEEIYSVPEVIKLGYFKVKILELMLFLTSIDIHTNESEVRTFSHTQKLLATDISSYLVKHMEDKIGLEQLSDIFHVSGTQIKSSIKAVYGIPLYNMIKIQKMQSAAKMLQDTNSTISEIAGLHGYDNSSKFSSAFKSIMGVSPKDYRNSPVEIENMFV